MTDTLRLPVRVLLVDDDRDDFENTRKLLSEIRGPRAYELHWATGYESGLAALQTAAHDVCLLDSRLGANDGVELLTVVAQRSLPTPIIFMTGRGNEGLEHRALALGASDYLSKRSLDAVSLERAIRHSLDRARALEASRKREREFRSVFEGGSDAMMISDDAGRVLESNCAALELLGVEPGLQTELTVAQLLSVSSTWEKFLADGRLGGELRVRRADTSERLVEYRATARITPGRHLWVLRDVSERKKLENQLALSERMAAVGMLAAGVAHEINNPLAALIANLSFIANRRELGTRVAPALSPDVMEPLVEAQTAAERIRLVVRDLKLFSRPEGEHQGPVDVSKLIDSTARMAWNEIRHRARFVTDYGDVSAVRANDSRLGQVFLNLIVNAAQAIREGNAEGNEIRVKTSMKEGFVVTTISDTGSGMPPETLRRLFEPFFTTKAPGLGTGLGLSICGRIIHELGGTIEVESALGRGTTFRVTLPASLSEEVPSPEPKPAKREQTIRARVLVIDDDVMLGRTVARTLQDDHDVTVVTNAGHALELLGSGAFYDVILCDVMMPQMTGIDLYETLMKSAPSEAQKIVFLSGGVFTLAARDFLERVPNLQLDKPFESDHLRELINERLRARVS